MGFRVFSRFGVALEALARSMASFHGCVRAPLLVYGFTVQGLGFKMLSRLCKGSHFKVGGLHKLISTVAG